VNYSFNPPCLQPITLWINQSSQLPTNLSSHQLSSEEIHMQREKK